MSKRKRVALAQMITPGGKEQLVLIRPSGGGLAMHAMYYADEVRDFGQIPNGKEVSLSDQEIGLGSALSRTGSLVSSKYHSKSSFNRNTRALNASC